MFSGGTFHSAMTAMSPARAQMREAPPPGAEAEARPEGRKSRAVGGKPHRDPELGYWLLPLPTIDPIVVARSGAALAAYGPDFRYSPLRRHQDPAVRRGGAAGVGGASGVAAQVQPLRKLLLEPDQAGRRARRERRAKSWFKVDFVAEGDGRTVHTRVAGGDPGYGETAKMLAESALCLAFDDNPPTAGQVTTAQAMGDNLIGAAPGGGHPLRGDRVTPDPDDVVALVDFLRQRLDEDVAAARRSMTGSWSVGPRSDDASRAARDLADAVVRRGLLDGADAMEREGRTAYADTVRRRLASSYSNHPAFRLSGAPWRSSTDPQRVEPGDCLDV